jgi:hypothetical protein
MVPATHHTPVVQSCAISGSCHAAKLQKIRSFDPFSGSLRAVDSQAAKQEIQGRGFQPKGPLRSYSQRYCVVICVARV